MTLRAFDLGTVTNFVSGTPYRLEVGGRVIVLVRSGNAFYAMRDTCPHQGARLSEGQVSDSLLDCDVSESTPYGRLDEVLRCPWHGWQFDLKTGRTLFDPENTRVRCYSVRVEDDRVIVEMQ